MLMMPLLGLNGGGAALVSDFGMGASYSATEAASATSVTLTVKTDGTWAITFGSGDTGAGTPTSGVWATNVFSGVGAAFELQFTTANEVGSPGVSNDAAAFTQITANLAIQIFKTAANASADVTVNLRKLGSSSTELTDTTNFAANGA